LKIRIISKTLAIVLLASVTFVSCGTSTQIGTLGTESKIPKIQIIESVDLPDNSLLTETDDLVVTTGNYAQPSKDSKIADKLFVPWRPRSYEGRGRIKEVWNIECECEDGQGVSSFGRDPFCWTFTTPSGKTYNIDPTAEKIVSKQKKTYGLSNTDSTMYLNNTLPTNRGMTTLSDNKGETIWKVNLISTYATTFGSSFIVDDYLVRCTDFEYHLGVNLKNGKADWKLRLSDRLQHDIFSANYEPIIFENYFWLLFNGVDLGNKLFRIDLSQQNIIGVLEYTLDDPQSATIINGKLCVVTSNRSTLLQIDVDTGIVKEEINLDKYIPGASFVCEPGNTHPFLVENTTKEQYIFNPEAPNKPTKLYGHVMGVLSNRLGFSAGTLTDNSYWVLNKEYAYGINPKTGEKTWWIPRNELGKNPEVFIVDSRGILVSHGNKVSAYGIKEQE